MFFSRGRKKEPVPKLTQAPENCRQNIIVPLPPLEEQTEIIDFLNSKCIEIDRLIERKDVFLSELESYKKSMIYEYVTGKKAICS